MGDSLKAEVDRLVSKGIPIEAAVQIVKRLRGQVSEQDVWRSLGFR
jgi:hypothetical protein